MMSLAVCLTIRGPPFDFLEPISHVCFHEINRKFFISKRRYIYRLLFAHTYQNVFKYCTSTGRGDSDSDSDCDCDCDIVEISLATPMSPSLI
jgi:hypothetical protein